MHILTDSELSSLWRLTYLGYHRAQRSNLSCARDRAILALGRAGISANFMSTLHASDMVRLTHCWRLHYPGPKPLTGTMFFVHKAPHFCPVLALDELHSALIELKCKPFQSSRYGVGKRVTALARAAGLTGVLFRSLVPAPPQVQVLAVPPDAGALAR